MIYDCDQLFPSDTEVKALSLQEIEVNSISKR